MTFDKSDIINYRIEKSDRTLLEAKSLFESGFYSGSVNRLYYSCFHIVSALLLKNDITASTHNGIRTQFFKNFIKNEKIEKKFSVLYADLMNKRQETDYDDFMEFKKEDVVPLISEVELFIETIKNII